MTILLDHRTVLEMFTYDPIVGELYWRTHVYKKFIGRPAGHFRRYGYRGIMINGKNIIVHRLIWLYVYGKEPSGVIDHINGITSDNRIENLRDVDCGENSRNNKRHRKGLPVGVRYIPKTDRWETRFTVNHVCKSIGSFDTEAAAAAAYQQALEQYRNGETITTYPRIAKHYGWHKASGKWYAQVKEKGKNIWLGLFKTEQEAKEAYSTYIERQAS